MCAVPARPRRTKKKKKMADAAMCFVKPPDPLEIYTGNPAHSWEKWKRKFGIYLQACGASTKPDVQKIGLLLNHIGDRGEEIYTNFTFAPATQDGTPAENTKYDKVVDKFDQYFTKRDPQLMLREKFWLHLKREPGQSFDSWVNTVRERAGECKFPEAFKQQAIRDKITFSCTEDHAKLKLYDEGAALSLEKAMKILSLKEATSQELKESKTASIDFVHKGEKVHNPKGGQKWKQYKNKSNPAQPPRGQESKKCGYCDTKHTPGKKHCPAAKHKCEKCKKVGHFAAICRSTSHKHVSQVDSQEGQTPTFVGETTVKNNCIDQGWHIQLNVNGNTDELTWCIDTGAQVSVMPETFYKDVYGTLCKPDRKLVGAGDTPLDTVGCMDLNLTRGKHTQIKEKVYVVRGASKLLLGVPAIRSLGLIHEIPGTYSIKTVEAVRSSQTPPVPDSPLVTKEQVVKEYPQLFQGLGKLEGEHTIILKEDAVPFCLTAPRRVPLPLLDKVKEEIRRLEELDVIETVDEPTDWCAPIVVVPKASGDVRMCVDLTKLNPAVKREVHPMPKVENTLGKIANPSGKRRLYSKIDANSGFHQLVLDADSRKYTTFITPFGRYMFKRVPYGITSAPEIFQKKMEKVLEGLDGVICHNDDVIIEGDEDPSSTESHAVRLRAVLARIKQSGLTLNLDKCLFAQTAVGYLGQIVDGLGVRKDPAKVKAIVEFPEPHDITALRRFLGMANQLMKFCNNLAELTQPLRDLLKTSVTWIWGPAQDQAFNAVKTELASDRVLALYNSKYKTIVSADASSYGLGGVLLQVQPSGETRPVAYASRTMTDTERRYAQIEKEALATTWALEHWQDLLIGMQGIEVETDHKPLVPLFSTKSIDELPVRIQRFRMRLMRYDFVIKHVSGKQLYTADAFSRSPVEDTSEHNDELQTETECYVRAVIVNLPASDTRLDQIRQELKKDETLKVVMYHVQHGWPEDKRKVNGPIGAYWRERSHMSIHEGLLLKGRRLVIPETLRCDILRYLHDGHQGVVKTRQNASSSVWWPGLSRDIDKLVRNCNTCERYRKERIEPMKGTQFPDRPWAKVGADFFYHKGNNYLLVIDYFSRDVEICLVSKTVNTADTVQKVKKVFSRHGVCDTFFTDNGPQFSSTEFREFAKQWNFEHVTSSPKYAQSNGEAERAVRTMKSILNKCDDEYLALLNYRNTPLHNGYSPAQLAMGRSLKTRVPVHPSELLPKLPDYTLVRKREREYREKLASNYDQRHRVVEADQLSPGDRVWIPDQQVEGTVVQNHAAPRSVIIQTPTGNIRRNRRMTRRLDMTPRNDMDEQFPVTPAIVPDIPVQVGRLPTPNVVPPDEQANPLRRSNRIRKKPDRYIDQY